MNKTYNITIAGTGGVGKTTFIRRHTTGDFSKIYDATFESTEYKLQFHTNHGDVIFNILDTPGQNYQFEWNRNIDAAIVMFDITSQFSYKNAAKIMGNLRLTYGEDFPVVLCGNKIDCERDAKVEFSSITLHDDEKCIAYHNVSAKSNYNIEKPFLSVLRHFNDTDDVYFCATPKTLETRESPLILRSFL